MTHVTCRLTVKNLNQLRNPALGSRIWATFTFFTVELTESVGCCCVNRSDAGNWSKCPAVVYGGRHWSLWPHQHDGASAGTWSSAMGTLRSGDLSTYDQSVLTYYVHNMNPVVVVVVVYIFCVHVLYMYMFCVSSLHEPDWLGIRNVKCLLLCVW